MAKIEKPSVFEADSEYNLSANQTFQDFMREAQAYYISERLAECGGNQAEAARRAGMHKDTFHKKVRLFALSVGRAVVTRGA